MAIVRFTEEELDRMRAQMTPEQKAEEEARFAALEQMSDDDIDYSEMPEWTDEDWARAVRVSDYPSEREARAEARHLLDMQRAGMGVKELEAYKASRIKQTASV
jgi:hypothetical protein